MKNSVHAQVVTKASEELQKAVAKEIDLKDDDELFDRICDGDRGKSTDKDSKD